MGDYTRRKERTLPVASTSFDDDEATTDSNTILDLELSPPVPERNRTVSKIVPDTGGQAEYRSPKGESTASDARARRAGRKGRWARAFRTHVKILAWMAVFPVLCILPFIVVLRISVLAYQENTYDGWQALVIGIIAAVLLVSVYIAAFLWTFGIRWRFYMPFLNICLTAMLCYSGYVLFHLATSNAKTQEVRSYYTSLHPFLRIAVRNLTIIEKELVITDVQRTEAAYRRMGLPPREYSLHFRQPTGFVHAVDIRTNGRSKVTNMLVELYFILMGFQTIRHVGTADHLHVALPLVDSDALAASSKAEEKN